MTQAHYHSTITVPVTPQAAVKNINRVFDWWTSHFEGAAEKLHDRFTIWFGDTFSSFEVVEIKDTQRIVWLVTDCNLQWLQDKKEWKGTQIEWEISSKGDHTQIDFTHKGLVPEIECFEDCKKGWNFYITESLRKLITEGKGLPETPKAAR